MKKLNYRWREFLTRVPNEEIEHKYRPMKDINVPKKKFFFHQPPTVRHLQCRITDIEDL